MVAVGDALVLCTMLYRTGLLSVMVNLVQNRAGASQPWAANVLLMVLVVDNLHYR